MRYVGLLLLVVACGGHTADPPVVTESMPTAPAPVRRPTPEALGDIGAPSAMTLDGDLVVVTTRATLLEGELVQAGGLFVLDKRAPDPLMIGLDREGVAWTALATDGASAFVGTADGRLLSTSLRGGAMAEVAALDEPATQLAVAGQNVYVATASRVLRVAKAGGAPEVVVESPARSFAAKEDVLFVAGADGAIRRIDAQGSKTIATGAPACALARDDGRLFWTALDDDRTSIQQIGFDGSNQATIAAGAFAACALATDASDVFFATTAPGALPVRSNGAQGLGLMRAPVSGGTPVAIAEAAHALPQPGAVAVDAKHLYWLTASSVMRLAK